MIPRYKRARDIIQFGFTDPLTGVFDTKSDITGPCRITFEQFYLNRNTSADLGEFQCIIKEIIDNLFDFSDITGNVGR